MARTSPAAAGRIEQTWPAGTDEHAVTELASEWQGASSPFGSDTVFPVPLERHARRWTVRKPGTDRHDTDF